ncbi:MAG: N-acetylneuraminate synthase family protein [Fimbriimonadaceae bacterium]|nr:N-acetylneuraminate synthase family protein [Fimbriimonadaceae bacterium]
MSSTREWRVAGRRVADDTDCFVIAEIGHNHQGSLEKAKQMFEVAKQCGVDAVKLQKRDNRTLFTKAMYDSPYDNENSFGETYGAHREALEFGRSEYLELQKLAADLGLVFFATAFDVPSADFLAEIDTPAYKIASADLINTPLLTYVAKIGKPIVLSTGGGTMETVQRAMDAVLPHNDQVCLLQCTAAYPVEVEDMNLRVLTTYREAFPNTVVGLSDHQDGIAMSVAAYVLGARVIEKHFTLHRSWKGTDHAFSLEPAGMGKMVRDLHRTRIALGDGIKRRLPQEERPLTKMAKSIYAARDMTVGTTLAAADLALKSPGGALPPGVLDDLIGRTLARPVQEDQPLTWDDVM